MSRSICAFDMLPIELVHAIFNYFWAHEILHSFTNISHYFDAILATYSCYRLNLSSISKSDFDLVCQRIRPSQIILLILSDANDTPGQSDLFLTRFRIEQFIQLRSLRLIEIELDSFESTFSNLNHLVLLRSLTYDTNGIKTKCPNWTYNYSGMLIDTISCWAETAMRVLPRLNRLNLSNLTIPPAIQLPHLCHLTLKKSTLRQLCRIFSQAPQLRSLHISIQGDASHIHHVNPCLQLNRLTLKLDDSRISITNMERFLPKITQLNHFELHAKGHHDLANGHRWKILTEKFHKFNFKLEIDSVLDEQTLNSFCTEFWLHKKHWYVAYHDPYIFSIPYFAQTEVNSSDFSLPSVWKTSDDTMFYKNVTKLNLSMNLDEDNMHIVSTMIDLNRIQRLTISSFNDIKFLNFYLFNMHCLHTLCISGSLSLDSIEQIRRYRFEQIRTLEICNHSEHMNYLIEELLRLFPCVEHLHMSSLQSRAQMIRLIDGFQHLLSASFTILSRHNRNERHWYFEPELSIRGTRRLNKGSFRCRVYRKTHTSSSYDVHIWIGEQSRRPCWTTSCPLQRGYYWHRLMFMVFPKSNASFCDSLKTSCIVSSIAALVTPTILPRNVLRVYGGFVSGTLFMIVYVIAYIILHVIHAISLYHFPTKTRKMTNILFFLIVILLLIPFMDTLFRKVLSRRSMT